MVKYFDNIKIVIIFDYKFFVMKNTIGSPARKESFYPRVKEIKKILESINDDNNIQLAAPRRVGKTSILFSLIDNQIENHLYVYVDTEAIDDAQQFFKKILKEILKHDEIKESSKFQKLLENGNKFLKRIKSVQIVGSGFEFKDQEGVDFREELENLLCGIELDPEKKLILLIDEFPQTIQNIIEKNQTNQKTAIQFLQSNRDLRLNPDINGKVAFIYTGSIGLNHTVSKVDGTAFINDINSIEIGPLKKDDAHAFINLLLASKKKEISPECAKYLTDKLEWLIPFHIQIAIQQILELSDLNPQITIQNVDEAFDNIIQIRNNNHFEHYHSRLRKTFKDNQFHYANELLIGISINNTISKGEAFDLAAKHDVKESWRKIIEILMYDGYINNNMNPDIYRFNSPILRMWWKRFIS